jgi:hypothetical protein
MSLTPVVVAVFTLLALGACSADPVEETVTLDEAIGVRPVDPNTGQPINPSTGQPADDYPLGYCMYVCSLGKRLVAMTNACKGVGVCDDVADQECTQAWRKTPFDERACPSEVKRSCVNPNLKLP